MPLPFERECEINFKGGENTWVNAAELKHEMENKPKPVLTPFRLKLSSA